MKKFQGKVAVVTGAGGTLCSEISRFLASEGALVYLVGRTEEKLQKVADSIKNIGGRCKIFTADVTSEEKMLELAELTMSDGGCDILVNGAGGNDVKAMPTITSFDPRELDGTLPEGQRGLYDVDMEAFKRVLDINIMGTVTPTLIFGKQMIKKGCGSVLNFASMNSYCPLTRCFAYAMSKAAISNLTQSFAAYYAPAGIRIKDIILSAQMVIQSHKVLSGIFCPCGHSHQRHCPRLYGQREKQELSRNRGGGSHKARRAGHRAHSDGSLWRGVRSYRLCQVAS